MEREKIADTVKGFLELVGCQEMDVLNLALDTYAERNPEFDEALIRRLIEKLTVHEDHFTVSFKSGVSVDINE